MKKTTGFCLAILVCAGCAYFGDPTKPFSTHVPRPSGEHVVKASDELTIYESSTLNLPGSMPLETIPAEVWSDANTIAVRVFLESEPLQPAVRGDIDVFGTAFKTLISGVIMTTITGPVRPVDSEFKDAVWTRSGSPRWPSDALLLDDLKTNLYFPYASDVTFEVVSSSTLYDREKWRIPDADVHVNIMLAMEMHGPGHETWLEPPVFLGATVCPFVILEKDAGKFYEEYAELLAADHAKNQSAWVARKHNVRVRKVKPFQGMYAARRAIGARTFKHKREEWLADDCSLLKSQMASVFKALTQRSAVRINQTIKEE